MATPRKANPLPGGRPTAYRPDFAHMAYVLCSRFGIDHKKLALTLDVNPDTLYEWKKHHPEFSESVRKGLEEYNTDAVEKALVKKALGYEYNEIEAAPGKKKKADGTPEMVVKKITKKHMPPDPRAIQFYLKNVKPGKWQDKQQIDHNINLDILFAGMMKVDQDFAERVRLELISRLSEADASGLGK